jgi:hypothetical protein
MELLAIWQRGFYQVGVCFALSVMGVEGAGVGEFIGEWGLLGCGVAVMEQVTRGSKHDKGRGASVAGGGCAAKGKWGGAGAHGGGHACGGHG